MRCLLIFPPGGSPPADDRITIAQDVTYSHKVFYVIVACSVIGIIYAFSLFLFNLLNRDKKSADPTLPFFHLSPTQRFCKVPVWNGAVMGI